MAKAKRLLVPKGRNWKDELSQTGADVHTYQMEEFSPKLPGLHAEAVKAPYEIFDRDVKVAMNPTTFGEHFK